jgi:hypothetical protein
LAARLGKGLRSLAFVVGDGLVYGETNQSGPAPRNGLRSNPGEWLGFACGYEKTRNL